MEIDDYELRSDLRQIIQRCLLTMVRRGYLTQKTYLAVEDALDVDEKTREPLID